MSPQQKAANPIDPAVRWFLRLRDEDQEPLDSEELVEWERFAAEPANRRELGEAKALWEIVNSVGGPSMPSKAELRGDHYDGTVSIEDWESSQPAPARDRSTAYGRPGLWLFAATVAVVAIGVGVHRHLHLSMRAQVQAVATPVAEQRTLQLPDGSSVTLGARTEIRTEIASAERRIILHSGEAWFRVARDSVRPFRVIAGSGVITALGTEFNVRRDMGAGLDQVTVTVGSGAVKVERRSPDGLADPSTVESAADHGTWRAAKVGAGQELTYSGSQGPSGIRKADVEAAIAWTEGRLEYIHEPLKAVIARVNRYSEKPMILGDDAAGEIDFSGTVFEGQIDDWVRALEASFPISITETDDSIVIRSRH